MMIRLIWSAAAATLLVGCGTLFYYGKPGTHAHVPRNEAAILLHGLCRSALSMKLIERSLKHNGYSVINIGYASTRSTISTIAKETVAPAVSDSLNRGYGRIHFVTHSLGAIVVRNYLQTHQLPSGSRIVMLAPPNQGSELIDWAQKKFPHLSKLAGPAACQLGTGKDTLISRLAPIAPETGIIIGNDSWNTFFSKILPGSDDGKVTVARAKLKEMRDFLIAPCNHTTILLNREVRQQISHFLQYGQFAQVSPMSGK